MQKIQGITGLRGLVALIIVSYHLQQIRPIAGLSEWSWDLYQFWNMLPVVVSVFFILSGLLRSLSYWSHIHHGAPIPDTKKVILDRFWRIMPLYLVVLICSLVWTLSIYPTHWIDTLISGFAGIFLLNWTGASVFFPVIENGPLWFVGYDMMSYLLVVAMMIGLFHIHKKYRYITIIVYIMALVSMHLYWISLPWARGEGIVSVWFPYYSPWIFGVYGLMGVIIGDVVSRYQKKSIFADIWTIIVSLSIIGYLWQIRGAPDMMYSYPLSPYRFPLVPLGIASLILSLIYSRYIGSWLDNRFFVWITSISYGLYLWHGLVVSIFRYTLFDRVSEDLTEWIVFSTLVTLISLGLGWFSMRYIETPILRYIKPKK